MIKFFRKIRRNLLKENPFSKYILYAFGEIILVMVGILLALQVNNWNQDHKSAIKERILLAELHQEFLANKSQFEKITSVHRKTLDACNFLIAKFPIDAKSSNLDSIPALILIIRSNWTFNPTQGIVKSLVNTSSFELISNQELRKLLITWNDVLVDYQEDELLARKYMQEVYNPYLNNHFHFSKIINDPRVDASILESVQFENLIYQRKTHLHNILGRQSDNESKIIQTTIDRIIELSNDKNQ